MTMVLPNCRAQLTAEDMEFILSVLDDSPGGGDGLNRLLSDAEAVDDILDLDDLFRAVLERQGCLTISKHLYFYILVRRVLCVAGIRERNVADYVASLLATFSNASRARRPALPDAEPMDYFVDMHRALEGADSHKRFLIRVYVGNHSLYRAGLFHQNIRYRAERKAAPDLTYYEQMGSMNFRVASDHRLAQEHDLAPVYAALSDCFRETRVALNDLADRLISLESPSTALNMLLSGPASN